MDKKKIFDKHIVFTTHSKERIKKRGLSQEWVVDIIRNHHIALPKHEDNTQEFRKERDSTYYYVVVEHKKSVIVVITAGEAEK